jgi:hypothetical protein
VSVGEKDKGEPEGSAESVPSENGLRPDRVSNETPPARAGVVYLLSELQPELSSQAGGVPDGAIPVHEIVLGHR